MAKTKPQDPATHKWVYENPFKKYYPFGTEMVYNGGMFQGITDFRCNKIVQQTFSHFDCLKDHEIEQRITECLGDAMVYVERINPKIFKKTWQRTAAFDMAEVWAHQRWSGKKLNHYELLCAYIIASNTFSNFC